MYIYSYIYIYIYYTSYYILSKVHPGVHPAPCCCFLRRAMVARTVAAGPVLRVQQPPAMILEPPKNPPGFWGGYPTAPQKYFS